MAVIDDTGIAIASSDSETPVTTAALRYLLVLGTIADHGGPGRPGRAALIGPGIAIHRSTKGRHGQPS